MRIQDVIRQELPPFQEELAVFFERFPKDAEVYRKKVLPGEYLIREGTPCFHVYVVLDGKVKTQYYLGHNAFIAKQFGRLAVMGDIAALGNLKYYSASIQTITECRLLKIRIVDYWNWLFCDQEFLRKQTETAIGIILEELNKKRALEETSAQIRLLSYFAFYCRKVNLDKNTSRDVIVVRATREKIAEEVGGISVRTVNRKLSSFAQEGLVTIVHGKIQISQAQLRKIETIMEEKIGVI